jgi:hypothetical protein
MSRAETKNCLWADGWLVMLAHAEARPAGSQRSESNMVNHEVEPAAGLKDGIGPKLTEIGPFSDFGTVGRNPNLTKTLPNWIVFSVG